MNVNSANLIRFVAFLLMVMVHTSPRGMAQLHPDWWIANAWDSLSRVCVPLFFMLSGALLVDKEEPLDVFFRKRASKILIPFVAWSLLYIAFKIFVEQNKSTNPNPMSFLAGPTYFHLWFMYALMGLYMLMPLLRAYYRSASPNLNVYVVSCCFLGLSAIPLIKMVIPTFSLAIVINFLPQYAGFMLLGVMFKKSCSARAAQVSFLGLVACFSITFIATYILSTKTGKLNETFYNYHSLNIVIMSSFAFVLLNWAGTKITEKCRSILAELGACSFGAYLMHMMVMQTFLKYFSGILPPWNSGWISVSIPLLAAFVATVSIVITFALRRFFITRTLLT